jgi:hypothetical protein
VVLSEWTAAAKRARWRLEEIPPAVETPAEYAGESTGPWSMPVVESTAIEQPDASESHTMVAALPAPAESTDEQPAEVAEPEAEEPAADGTVRLFDFNFEFPETMAPGRQVWAVTNTGEQPHELLLARSPQPITTEQVMELLADPAEEATPTGGGPSFADFEPVGGIGWLSPGLTAWTEVDLEPGTYVALCFVFDPQTGLPHVAMGMVAVFTVGAGTATPVP